MNRAPKTSVPFSKGIKTRRPLQPGAASSPALALLHPSVIKATNGQFAPILDELTDVGRECLLFLTELLGNEAYASPDFTGSRVHAQILWMLLSTTFTQFGDAGARGGT